MKVSDWLNAEMDELIDDPYEDEFQKMRAEAYKWKHDTFQNFFNQWCKEAGVTVVAYNLFYPEYGRNGQLIVYTTRPGCMIGYKGTLVNKYKEMLEKEFRGKYDIKFEEIQGEFIIIKEEF